MTSLYDSHVESIWQGVVPFKGFNLFQMRLILLHPIILRGQQNYMTTPYDSHMESNWQGVVTIKGFNLFYIGCIGPQPIILQDQGNI